MNIILIVFGTILFIFGWYKLIESLLFLNHSTRVNGIIIKRELMDNEDSFIVHFAFENNEYEYRCVISPCGNIGDVVLMRVLKGKKQLHYKINKIQVIFSDSIISFPLASLLLLGGFFLS